MTTFEFLHYLYKTREDVLNGKKDIPLSVVEQSISDCERFTKKSLELGVIGFDIVKGTGHVSGKRFDLRILNKHLQ